MTGEFDNTFYLIVKMSLTTFQSDAADDAINALGAFIVHTTLPSVHLNHSHPLAQLRI